MAKSLFSLVRIIYNFTLQWIARLKSFVYVLQQSGLYRQTLKRYRRTMALQCAEITALDIGTLQKQGLQVLVLDFDGVLTAHGEVSLSPSIVEWLSKSVGLLGPDKVFILSNQPNTDRVLYFQEHFPGVQVVKAARKKPYPDGIEAILTLTGVPKRDLLMVDDRLLTGILAAVISGVSACWVSYPQRNFYKRPVQELWYHGLRFLERMFF
jgi:HAD superfamily phosphatase (TIGR01668 family)